MIISKAEFSPCRKWRYSLLRMWATTGSGIVSFICLNPSTADEMKNDPTVTRCINYARKWGYDGMRMLNIFAYRSTDPKGLLTIKDPVGLENDISLVHYTGKGESELVVAAWGTHGEILNRHHRMRTLLEGRAVHVLGLTKHGYPKHPLYLRGDLSPVLWGKR